MSGKTLQKHLACHDFHMGLCSMSKDNCPYSHVGTSYGICPNKHYCTTPHKLVMCPLLQSGGCPVGPTCSYKHQNDEPKPTTQATEEVLSSVEQTQMSASLPIDLSKKQTKNRTMEEFRTGLLELHRDLQILAPYLQIDEDVSHPNQAYHNHCLDLCFIVDLTGSMSSWITQTLRYINNTLTTLQDDFPGIGLRMALSGYRDYCDTQRYETFDFTENLTVFTSFLSGVRCMGGGDTAEDVVGGLTKALELNWLSQARQVFLICDAPAHGKKYHAGVSDDYPNGDPKGLIIEEKMQEFQKKRISFTAVEANSSTKIMLQIMKQSFSGMEIKPLNSSGGRTSTSTSGGGGDAFDKALHESVKKTVTTSISKGSLGSGSSGQSGKKNGIDSAYNLIMRNKKFKSGFSRTASKTRTTSGRECENILFQQIRGTAVVEEEEFDSDDGEYEKKLASTCQKQFQSEITERKEREQILKDKQLAQLKSQFPAHYFETVDDSETLMNSIRQKKKNMVQKVEYLRTPINWDRFESYQDYQAICHSFELIHNARNGTEINWKCLQIRTFFLGTKVRLSNLVFSEGAMRYAYHAKDLYLKQRMVAKQYKKVEKQQTMTIEDMKRDILSQIVCKYIVKEFNGKITESMQRQKLVNYDEETGEESQQHTLQFIDCYIYQMTFPYTAVPLFYFEKHIDGKYEKFNNNAGYVTENDNVYSQLSQTLSHFSWQLSKGYLAIVDLQGNDTGILTDPQVHCLDDKKFGDGNLGYEGILRFFATHKCNDYCRQLQLVNPMNNARMPEMNSFFVDMHNQTLDVKETSVELLHLCDVCQHSKYFTVQQIFDCKKANKRLVCETCIKEIKASTLTKKCSNCDVTITFSTFECVQLRRDIPPFCDPCTIATETYDQF